MLGALIALIYAINRKRRTRGAQGTIGSMHQIGRGTDASNPGRPAAVELPEQAAH